MSVRVFSSNDLSELARILQDSISGELEQENGLYSPLVVIPNKSMETWLYLEFAKRKGVVFNLRFLFLEKAIEELLKRKYGSDPDFQAFARPEERKFLIYEYVQNHPEFLLRYPSLRSYLIPSGRQNIDPTRLFEFSGKIANYFKDYELHRQDWIRNWLGGKTEYLRLGEQDIEEKIATKSQMFFLQKELYAAVAASSKTLVQYAMQAGNRKQSPRPENGNLESKKLYLFGLSQLSQTYLALFKKLFPELSLEAYQFGLPRDSAGTEESISLPCRRWASPFRSLFASWNLTGASIRNVSSVRERKDKSVLTSFQEYLLVGPNALSDRKHSDASLVILEAPGIFREVEAVFHIILSKLDEDPTLNLTDIGIFCPNLSQYRPAIQSVFDGGIPAKLINENGSPEFSVRTLPYTIQDIRAGETSPFLNGILSVFPLLLGKRSRTEFFALFRNSCFQKKWDISAETVREWEELSRELSLFLDDSQEGPPLPFSFRNGFLRLSMGEVLPTVAEEETSFSPYSASDRKTVELWIGTWKRLEEMTDRVTEECGRSEIDPDGCLDSFTSFLRELLGPTEDSPEENSIASELFSKFGSLRGKAWDPGNFEDRLRFLEVFVRESCEGIPIRKGKYLTGGITVSSLQPMRPIPFRHIFLLGLGEVEFPGSEDRSAFNLRHLSPRDGDVTNRQLNELLLYETVLSAKESLNLSFVSVDSSSEEEMAPSPSILQMEQVLRDYVLHPEESTRVLLPLNKHSRQYFEPRPEGKDFRIRYFETYDISSSAAYGFEKDKVEYSKTFLDFRNPRSVDPIRKPDVRSETEAEITLDLKDLIRFWRSPLQHFLRSQFGLFVEEQKEDNPSSSEPFRLSDPLRILTKSWELFFKALSEKSVPKDSLELFRESREKAISAFGKKGFLPRGKYGRVEEILLSERFERSWSKISPLLEDRDFYEAISFGESTKQGRILTLPTPTLTLKNGSRIRFTGLKESIFLSPEMRSIVLVYPNSKKKLKNGIEPFLIQSILDLVRTEHSPKTVSVLFGYTARDGAPEILEFEENGSERTEFLKYLTEEYLGAERPLLSPDFWEDFPLRKSGTLFDSGGKEKEELGREFLQWVHESLEYELSDYVPATLRLLPSPKRLVPTNAFELSEKLYDPVFRGLFS
ncbi:exodeoxyribonuclease V subunit gamma [Leptospira fletcheri]|uniref:Exodeoxyribonuclease V subunit gamma n=1 Tax=Leptospira fletcheri TaxID=2484981 RepID=A0A4V3JD82_9LEPT|nr:exodeoxyribonuclease V subunit gamma [Leptospira fletcheri]TGK08939.1 exodeoxyribonuclease V subunit gamma [Leptospira fletcheri]